MKNLQKIATDDIKTFIFVFVTIIFIILNIFYIPVARENAAFRELKPNYGNVLRDYYRTDRDRETGDRNWYLYRLIERKFRGWSLISYAAPPARFSGMYAFNFGGIAATRIVRYDAGLTAAEAEELLARPHWRGVVTRVGPYVVVFPAAGATPGRAVVLRHGATHFLVPARLVPGRLVIP